MKEGRDFSVCNFVKGPFKKIIFFYTGQVGMMMSLWRQKYKFAHRFTKYIGAQIFTPYLRMENQSRKLLLLSVVTRPQNLTQLIVPWVLIWMTWRPQHNCDPLWKGLPLQHPTLTSLRLWTLFPQHIWVFGLYVLEPQHVTCWFTARQGSKIRKICSPRSDLM